MEGLEHRLILYLEECIGMLNLVKRLVREEEGQGLVEYALIIGLVSVVIIGALGLLGDGIGDIFAAIGTKLSGITIP